MRSDPRVTSLTVTFSGPGLIRRNPRLSFLVDPRQSGGAVVFTASTNVIGVTPVVTLDAFSGTETQFGSLRDGRYTLTVFADQVSAGGVNMASNHTFGERQVLSASSATSTATAA